LKIYPERVSSDHVVLKQARGHLEIFDGLVHDHLIPLLATFTQRGHFHSLFPLAQCNLEHYWHKVEPAPKMDVDTVRWMSQQCHGITAAVGAIHNRRLGISSPSFMESDMGSMHGNIKSTKVLWFRSTRDPKGILVIGNTGLSTFKFHGSRSRIRSEPMSIELYQAPEIVMKNSRAAKRDTDIWALGCLFLEMLTWLLGGRELLLEFEELLEPKETRYSKYGEPYYAYALFDLEEVDDGYEQFAVRVKPEVTKVS
jgi:serine/threonine protein kinase